jgi:hypothetical protein
MIALPRTSSRTWVDGLALLIALLSGDFPLAADADALEGVDVASAFFTLDLRSTLADVCF